MSDITTSNKAQIQLRDGERLDVRGWHDGKTFRLTVNGNELTDISGFDLSMSGGKTSLTLIRTAKPFNIWTRQREEILFGRFSTFGFVAEVEA